MEHIYQNIPGWFNFLDVYRDAVREASNGAHFVEVGAWKGRSTAFMAVEIANSGKRIIFDCVDHFRGSDEAVHHADPDVQNGTLFKAFVRNVTPVIAFINVYRLSSVTAASGYLDQSLDLVMLDGAHDLDSVRADIRAFLPKLKPGATLAGDDWNWSGVKRAVSEAFAADKIEVLGKDRGVHWRVRL